MATMSMWGCQDVTIPTSMAPNPVEQDAGHCGALPLSSVFRVAPADPAKRYLRCGTLGGEVRWRVAISPDHSRFAARTNTGTVRLLSTQPWQELAELAAPLGRIDATAFSPDGTRLATFSLESGQVAVWRASDGTLERAYAVRNVSRESSPRGAALAFSRDGRQIAVSAQRLVDLDTAATRAWSYAPDAPAPDFRALAFLADDATLLADGLYRAGNAGEVRETLMLITPGGSEHRVLFDGFTSLLHGFAVSPDRTRIAFASADPAQPGLFVHALDEPAPVAVDPSFVGQVLAYSHDGARLYVAHDETVSVRDALSLVETARFTWSPNSTFLGLSPAGDIVAATAYETVWWDVTSGSARRRVPEALTDLAFSEDGVLGAASAGSALMRMWSERDGAERCSVPRRDAALPVLQIEPRTQPTGYVPRRLSGVTVLGQSRDGSVLATRTVAGTGESWISLIDANTHRTWRAFAANPDAVYTGRGVGVALSDDGTEAYTLEAEGVLGHDPYVATWCRDGQDRSDPSL